MARDETWREAWERRRRGESLGRSPEGIAAQESMLSLVLSHTPAAAPSSDEQKEAGNEREVTSRLSDGDVATIAKLVVEVVGRTDPSLSRRLVVQAEELWLRRHPGGGVTN